LFHAETWTAMSKAIFAFRNFANAPKNRQRGNFPLLCGCKITNKCVKEVVGFVDAF
jgi:hypothetical protein